MKRHYYPNLSIIFIIMPTRVLLLYQGYPQITKTYMHVELAALRELYIVKVFNVFRPANVSRHTQDDWVDCLNMDYENVLERARAFAPDHIHSHYLHTAPLLTRLADVLNVSCSLRCHSYDILEPSKMGENFPLAATLESIPGSNLTGILAFPFEVPILEKWGISNKLILPTPPVVDVARFRYHGEHDSRIMNIGAALPKKNMREYIDLAVSIDDMQFDLYGVGFHAEELIAYNKEQGNPCSMVASVDHIDMPGIYRQHSWLVYTASSTRNSVGWPVAIAEAQASGVGVCLQNIRPDMADYLNDSGILFDHVSELTEVLRSPPPPSLVEAGYENAERYDYALHYNTLHKLIDAA